MIINLYGNIISIKRLKKIIYSIIYFEKFLFNIINKMIINLYGKYYKYKRV